MLAAVTRGDVDAVLALLKQKADVNVREADGSTPHAELVRVLIGAGADVNAANRYGITPLIEASRLGSTPLIDALLKAGANPNVKLPEDETPLMAGAGNLEAVKLFIARAADVNAREGSQNQAALMWAAEQGRGDVASALLGADADPNRLATHTIHYDGTGGAGAQGVPTAINESPFARALRDQGVAVVKLMLGKGASASAPVCLAAT